MRGITKFRNSDGHSVEIQSTPALVNVLVLLLLLSIAINLFIISLHIANGSLSMPTAKTKKNMHACI